MLKLSLTCLGSDGTRRWSLGSTFWTSGIGSGESACLRHCALGDRSCLILLLKKALTLQVRCSARNVPMTRFLQSPSNCRLYMATGIRQHCSSLRVSRFHMLKGLSMWVSIIMYASRTLCTSKSSTVSRERQRNAAPILGMDPPIRPSALLFHTLHLPYRRKLSLNPLKPGTS